MLPNAPSSSKERERPEILISPAFPIALLALKILLNEFSILPLPRIRMVAPSPLMVTLPASPFPSVTEFINEPPVKSKDSETLISILPPFDFSFSERLAVEINDISDRETDFAVRLT